MLDPNTDSKFLALIQDSERPDGYVNATKWCKHFEYALADWKRSPQTKAQIKALRKHWDYSRITPCIVEGKGRTATTWVHPIMAVHLAQYLSPEFANFVAQTFKRYLEGDAGLAIEIIDRNNNPEDLKRIEQRIKTKISNKGLNSAISQAGGTCFAAVADINNIAIVGGTAKQIQAARGVKKTRDGLTRIELAMLETAELLEQEAIEEERVRGDRQIISTCKNVATTMASLRSKKIQQLA